MTDIMVILRRRLKRWQDQLGVLLGSPPEQRAANLEELLRRDPAETTGYWLSLGVAVGIASLGLVLNSTAVVIGAMLIAPLMTPIVALAMGLAVGSPFLVLRSVGRVLASIVCAVAGSAALTRSLPFHELTTELAARTTPTALDLLTAAFCAVAGAYAALRPGSNTAATAAGTSIGISLVPPLCTSGYGVGVGNWVVAKGAALLFVANLSAIVVVGSVIFTAAGFHRVDVATLERQQIERGSGARVARAASRALSRIFSTPGGFIMRLVLPFALLAIVYVPLRRALDEVAWQFRVRAEFSQSLSAMDTRVVEHRLRTEGGIAEAQVLIVGEQGDAVRIREQLSRALARVPDTTARIEVVALPDANALTGLATALRNDQLQSLESTAPTPAAKIRDAQVQLQQILQARWPRSAGALLATHLDLAASPLRILVVHEGSALTAPTLELLQRALGDALGSPLSLSARPIARHLEAAEDTTQFWSDLGQLVSASRLLVGASVCGTAPEPESGKPSKQPQEENARIALAKQVWASDVAWTTGPTLSADLVEGPCSPPAPPAPP